MSTSSSPTPGLLEVGRVTRPHGVRGEVNVVLITNRAERVAPGSVLTTADGRLVVRSSRPHKNGWIVRFAEVPDRDAAEALRNTVLRAEPIDDPDELWVHEVIGARVIDQLGIHRGTVVRVLENPASDLLELDSGPLVPMRFIVSLTAGDEVSVDVPAGLFDLDEQ